jgi:rubrerythrin
VRTIESAAELYAHAIAIEREAAERYSELAERM